jgi:Zn-dependent hydrolase
MEMMGEVSGFMLQAENQPTVYIVGDCLWTEEIKANIKRYQPDWIIINTGGAIIPALSSTFGTLIMNEKDVVSMIKESPSKCRFIAVHMDAIDHCQTTRSILRNEADKAGITKDKLMIPEDGEIILLNN